ERLTVSGNLLVSGNSTTTNSTSTNFFATTGRFTNLCLTGDNCITSWPTGGAFSTTSALYFLAQNQGNAFSTTSADYYLENDGLLAGYDAIFGNLQATASSTIGGGTGTTGLTVSGNSTTTGDAYFMNNVEIFGTSNDLYIGYD